jgi:hypothetical protein
MKLSLKIIGIFFCLISLSYSASSFSRESSIDEKADLIIFSFDRPLQLYALLESIEKYITGLDQIMVIYRVSNDDYNAAYEQVYRSFPSTLFIKQGVNPQGDFKPLTVKSFLNSPCKYILFAVDDIVVKDYVNINECIDALKQVGAYGFYLRLGKNLSDCYPANHKQRVPQLIEVPNNIYAWRFSQGEYDWGYPNTVDMTLYRKEDIASDLVSLPYCNPNTFEGMWAGNCHKVLQIVNLPLNRVQQDYQNRANE